MALSGYKDIPFNVDIHLATEIGVDALENITFNVKREEGVSETIQLGSTTQNYTGDNWDTFQSLSVTGKTVGKWFIEYTATISFSDDVVTGQFSVEILDLSDTFLISGVAGIYDPTTGSYINGGMVAGKPSIGVGDTGFTVSISGGYGCFLEIHAPDGTISHASAGGGGGTTIVNCSSQAGTWFAYVHTQVALLAKNIPLGYNLGPLPTVTCNVYNGTGLPVNPIDLKGTATGKLIPGVYWDEISTQHIGPGPYGGGVYTCGEIPGSIIEQTIAFAMVPPSVITGGFAAGVVGVSGTSICFTAPGGYVRGRCPISSGGVIIGDITGLVNATV